MCCRVTLPDSLSSRYFVGYGDPTTPGDSLPSRACDTTCHSRENGNPATYPVTPAKAGVHSECGIQRSIRVGGRCPHLPHLNSNSSVVLRDLTNVSAFAILIPIGQQRGSPVEDQTADCIPSRCMVPSRIDCLQSGFDRARYSRSSHRHGNGYHPAKTVRATCIS